MRDTADAIIVGGGIIGASIAFHLAERGLKPVVVERRVVAAGATGKSSGLVRMHYDNEPESRLAWVSFAYFRDWADRVGAGDCSFIKTGFLFVAGPENTDRVRANVAMHQQIGINSQVVTIDDVRRLAPAFYVGDIGAAAYEPDSGYADPTGATFGFVQRAKELGARLLQETAVTRVLVDGGRAAGVETTAGAIWAPVVVNAAGARAGALAATIGVELPITGWRHQVAFFRRPPDLAPPHPTVIDDVSNQYFRPETGQLTLVGLEDGNALGDPETLVETLDSDFIPRAAERICRRMPAMEQAGLASGQVGIDGITPDQHAIIDQIGPEGFYVAAGFSGTGFKLGPAVGTCVAELISDGRATTVDVTPFRLRRFAEGKPLVGEHPYTHIWK
jgi:sarcosine oxidase subunit beta